MCKQNSLGARVQALRDHAALDEDIDAREKTECTVIQNSEVAIEPCECTTMQSAHWQVPLS